MVVPHHRMFERPQVYGARAQLIHTAIDVGIAVGALEDASSSCAPRAGRGSRPEVERASDDPLLIQRVGELAIGVRAAQALLDEAARTIDAVELGRRRRGRLSTRVDRGRHRQGVRRSRRRRDGERRCSSSAARARPPTSSTCTATGATRARTRCTTPCAGSCSTSAATRSTGRSRRSTGRCEMSTHVDADGGLAFHWFLPTQGDGRRLIEAAAARGRRRRPARGVARLPHAGRARRRGTRLRGRADPHRRCGAKTPG